MNSKRLAGVISIAFIFIIILILSIRGVFASWRENITNWTKDSRGWKYDQDGSQFVGWNDINGIRYYFNKNGYMQTGWLSDKSTWYYLKSNGEMKRGYLNDNGSWYYFDENGVMQTGWFEVDGKKNFADENGIIYTGINKVGDIQYYFDCNTFGLVLNANYYGVVTNESGQVVKINDGKANDDILTNDSKRIDSLKEKYGDIKVNYKGIYSLDNIFKRNENTVVSDRFNREDTSILKEQVLYFELTAEEKEKDTERIEYFVCVKDGTILTSIVEDSFNINLYQVKNNQILEEYSVAIDN